MKVTGSCAKCGRSFNMTWKDHPEDKNIIISYRMPCPRCLGTAEMRSAAEPESLRTQKGQQ